MVWSLKPSNTKHSFLTHIIFHLSVFPNRGREHFCMEPFMLASFWDLPDMGSRYHVYTLPLSSFFRSIQWVSQNRISPGI